MKFHDRPKLDHGLARPGTAAPRESSVILKGSLDRPAAGPLYVAPHPNPRAALTTICTSDTFTTPS